MSLWPSPSLLRNKLRGEKKLLLPRKISNVSSPPHVSLRYNGNYKAVSFTAIVKEGARNVFCFVISCSSDNLDHTPPTPNTILFLIIFIILGVRRGGEGEERIVYYQFRS